MNYLVHLHLAGQDPMCRLGSLMGDFVKGPVPDSYPPAVRTGLRHHRRIDSLAQVSPHTRSSRQRLDRRFGHARAILVDIFYDHFLARCWADYSDRTLEDFAAETYTLLREHVSLLPRGLREIAPRMTEHNWLVSYRDQAAVGRALGRLAQRLSRPLPLAEGVMELHRHRRMLEEDFHGFMQEAAALSRREFDIIL